MATALIVVFLLILIALVANIALVVRDKIETQNAADAAARSAATELARGLNTVTATNHLLGELLSFIALHDAIAGRDRIDQVQPGCQHGGESYDFTTLNTLLMTVHQQAEALQGTAGITTPSIALNEVQGPVQGEKTVLVGKARLKEALIRVYRVKRTARLLLSLKGVPVVGPLFAALGAGMESLAYTYECVILVEWKTLGMAREFARDARKVRLDLEEMLGVVQEKGRLVVRRIPAVTGKAGREIGPRNQASTFLYPVQPTLPVVPEQIVMRSPADLRQSQLVRAAFPWVNFRRRPILDAAFWMKFSRSPQLYRDFTTSSTLEVAGRYYAQHGGLYILKDSRTAAKGEEAWARDEKGSARADELFSVVALSHRPPTVTMGGPFFPNPNREGYVCYAQALVYNANPQQPRSGTATLQPLIGWDTLNWDFRGGRAVEHTNDVWVAAQGARPRVRLNWQAKLVPVTRLEEAVRQAPDPYGPILKRVVPLPPQFRTH